MLNLQILSIRFPFMLRSNQACWDCMCRELLSILASESESARSAADRQHTLLSETNQYIAEQFAKVQRKQELHLEQLCRVECTNDRIVELCQQMFMTMDEHSEILDDLRQCLPQLRDEMGSLLPAIESLLATHRDTSGNSSTKMLTMQPNSGLYLVGGDDIRWLKLVPIKEVTGQAITRRQRSCINWKRFCWEKLGIFKFVYSRVRSLDRDLEVLSKEEIHMELSFIPNFWLFSSSRMVRVQLHIERFPFDKNRIGSIAPNITFFPVFSDDSPQFACAR
jgi:hypothetical protein